MSATERGAGREPEIAEFRPGVLWRVAASSCGLVVVASGVFLIAEVPVIPVILGWIVIAMGVTTTSRTWRARVSYSRDRVLVVGVLWSRSIPGEAVVGVGTDLMMPTVVWRTRRDRLVSTPLTVLTVGITILPSEPFRRSSSFLQDLSSWAGSQSPRRASGRSTSRRSRRAETDAAQAGGRPPRRSLLRRLRPILVLVLAVLTGAFAAWGVVVLMHDAGDGYGPDVRSGLLPFVLAALCGLSAPGLALSDERMTRSERILAAAHRQRDTRRWRRLRDVDAWAPKVALPLGCLVFVALVAPHVNAVSTS